MSQLKMLAGLGEINGLKKGTGDLVFAWERVQFRGCEDLILDLSVFLRDLTIFQYNWLYGSKGCAGFVA